MGIPVYTMSALEPPRTREGTVRPMYSCDPKDALAQRPCPWEGCRHILPDGGCSIDVADDGPHTITQVALLLGLERDHVAHLARRGFAKAKRAAARLPPVYDDFGE